MLLQYLANVASHFSELNTLYTMGTDLFIGVCSVVRNHHRKFCASNLHDQPFEGRLNTNHAPPSASNTPKTEYADHA